MAYRLGTTWWDYDLQRICALVLQSASIVRAGEVAKSNYYDPNICLQWKHITITLSMTTSLLDMTVVFAHTKNAKRDPTNNKTCEFTELETDEHWLGPIIQLIDLALHTGAVLERSWQELKQNMINRPSHKIVWQHPDRPVFCARELGGQMTFVLDQPADKEIVQRAMGELWSRELSSLDYSTPQDRTTCAAVVPLMYLVLTLLKITTLLPAGSWDTAMQPWN